MEDNAARPPAKIPRHPWTEDGMNWCPATNTSEGGTGNRMKPRITKPPLLMRAAEKPEPGVVTSAGT